MTLLAFLTAAVFMIPGLFGIRPYIVLSGSMEPAIHTGAVAFIDTRDRDCEPGEIVTYRLSGKDGDVFVTHRVEAVSGGVYITKGDANQVSDLSPVRQDQIVPGNGAAELIKLLVENMEGRLGVIRPTFEEYANRYPKDQVVVMEPKDPDFGYGADEIMDFFGSADIRNLIIINPDNPSGNYIPRADILRLISWAKERKIRLIVDESFIDFASEPVMEGGEAHLSPAPGAGTILDENILDENPHLTVVKSISKSYGVPGLRLGIAASGDRDLIASLKKDVAIWNINSFAEFYLQIEEKYRKDYAASLKRLQAERSRFAGELSAIPGIRVLPSQANYLMAELTGCPSKWLTEQLLNRFNILIKDLSSKIPGDRQFVRIAVRDEKDDARLTEALREIMANSWRRR